MCIFRGLQGCTFFKNMFYYISVVVSIYIFFYKIDYKNNLSLHLKF